VLPAATEAAAATSPPIVPVSGVQPVDEGAPASDEEAPSDLPVATEPPVVPAETPDAVPTAAPVVLDTPEAVSTADSADSTETTFATAPEIASSSDQGTTVAGSTEVAEPVATIAAGGAGGDRAGRDSAAAVGDQAADSDAAAEVVLDEPAVETREPRRDRASEVTPVAEDEAAEPAIVPVAGVEPETDAPAAATEPPRRERPRTIEGRGDAVAETPEAADVVLDQPPAARGDAEQTDDAAASTATETIASGADVDQTENRRDRAGAGLEVALTLSVAASEGVAFTSDGTTAAATGAGVSVVVPSGQEVTLPGASAPIWSPRGGVLLVTATFDGNPSPTAAIWDRDSGSFQALAGSRAGEGDGAYRDLPAGWAGSVAYYQRVYLDGSGRVELRFAEVTGGVETGNAWSGETGSRFGEGVTAARVSPDGGSIAYAEVGQLYVAPLSDPVGGAVPIGGAGIGFDWAPSGNRLAVSDGASLTLVDRAGTNIGTVTVADSGIGAPLWRDDGIYLPLLDGSGTVVLIDPATINGE